MCYRSMVFITTRGRARVHGYLSLRAAHSEATLKLNFCRDMRDLDAAYYQTWGNLGNRLF
jgi:hypothetical protein